MAKDPVCGMTVDEASSHRSVHEGKTVVFCSPACKEKFDKEPSRYASPAGESAEKKGGCCA